MSKHLDRMREMGFLTGVKIQPMSLGMERIKSTPKDTPIEKSQNTLILDHVPGLRLPAKLVLERASDAKQLKDDLLDAKHRTEKLEEALSFAIDYMELNGLDTSKLKGALRRG